MVSPHRRSYDLELELEDYVSGQFVHSLKVVKEKEVAWSEKRHILQGVRLRGIDNKLLEILNKEEGCILNEDTLEELKGLEAIEAKLLHGNIEKKVNFWCKQWLCRGGKLVLVKLVLESILVY